MNAKFKARSLERKFIRSLQKNGFFHTLTGNVNYLVYCDNVKLGIRTNKDTGILEINRRNLRAGISYLFHKRTIIRKELEKYTAFSSAMMGILFKAFENLAHIQTMANGLLRLSLKGVRFFFSGVAKAPKDMQLLASEGGEFCLISYAHVRNQKTKKWLKNLKKFGLKTIIDSGAFSIYTKNQKRKSRGLEPEHDITVQEYASFINELKDDPNITGFFSLDVIGNPEGTKRNYRLLQKLTDAFIIPVFQITDSLSELENLVEESPTLIGIGGTYEYLRTKRVKEIRKKFNQIFHTFSNVNFHWLGGASQLLLEYPFFSSDSTAWLVPRWFGDRKIYNEIGMLIEAPTNWTTEQIVRQKIRYLLSLEDIKDRPIQLELLS